MTTTYTDAQIPCGECGMPCDPGEYHPYAACLMFKGCRNSTTVRANLTERQAGSSGDVHCPVCGTHEISLTRTCHNSACSEYAAETTVHEGWKNPPQPPTKESVRGVSDADVEAACLAYDNATSEVADYPWEEGIRAALESFANRGDENDSA